MTALLLLWEDMHTTYDVKFILTNRLNQDCVENLFAVIRSKGASRDNPDCGQFRAAFAQVLVILLISYINSRAQNTHLYKLDLFAFLSWV